MQILRRNPLQLAQRRLSIGQPLEALIRHRARRGSVRHQHRHGHVPESDKHGIRLLFLCGAYCAQAFLFLECPISPNRNRGTRSIDSSFLAPDQK